MSDYAQRIIFDLFQFRRSSFSATSIFSKLKHNADLCPRFQTKLETVFGAFDKYRRITYDIQGPRDQGTDVLARIQVNDENHFICLQIKSEDDLKDQNYLRILKSQFFDSEKAYQKLLDYYIVLCPDLNDLEAKRTNDKREQKRIDREAKRRGEKPRTISTPAPLDIQKRTQVRTILSEFANVKSPVHVIEPEYALTFLGLSSVQIDAAIKNKLGAEDIVFREALKLIVDLTVTEKAVLFYLIWLRVYAKKESLTLDDLFDSTGLSDIYDGVPDEDSGVQADWTEVNDRIVSDLQHLEGQLIESNRDGSYSLDIRNVDPVALLMMDGNIRYGYEQNELLLYMMNLFGPIEGYEPELENLE